MIKKLLNPIGVYPSNSLFVLGLLSLVVSTYLATVFSVRMDGVLDLHVVSEVSMEEGFSDAIINVLSLFIFLFAFGKWYNPATRAIDILNTVLIARIPYYFLMLFNLNNLLYNLTEPLAKNPKGALEHLDSNAYIFLGLFSLFAILLLVVYLIILFRSYKVSVNGKGNRFILFFALSIILAEILSKTIINLL
ncbi:MAG: hypothetical protein N4A45_07390 [Flavobacteriales bacterium]|jgi:hypothetical protein|nr:hypothetical protein [Flavobacteriales bacterium]